MSGFGQDGFVSPQALAQQTGIRMSASADFVGNGAIEVNLYEREILDLVRRTSVIRQRIPARKATGHPHRYFEQTDIAQASFTDQRNIQPTPSGPQRLERAAMIKCLTAMTVFSQFDLDVAAQQNVWPNLQDQDLEDMTNAIVRAAASAIWRGSDTNLAAPTSMMYSGLLNQITQQAVVAPGASLIDGLKTQIAVMAANTQFAVRPTAIYMSPLLVEYIESEAKAISLRFNEIEIVAGVRVSSIATSFGQLPLVPDPFLTPGQVSEFGFAAPPAGNQNYYAVIVSEDQLLRPVVSGRSDNMEPRLFQLGLQSGLAASFVAVLFDTIIAKGASYAHAVVACQRP